MLVHTTTAYFGGHTDVTGGFAVFADEQRRRGVRERVLAMRESADPFAAWLTLRGLRTLPLRMRQHCENAGVLARRPAAHPAVAAVHCPGMPGHPSHQVASRLLRDYGGLLAFGIAGVRDAARQFLDR